MVTGMAIVCSHGRSYGNWNGNTVFIWGGAMVTRMAILCL